MKKLVAAFITGVIIATPLSAFAWSKSQMARPLVGFDCSRPYKAGDVNHDGKVSEYETVDDPTGTNGSCSGTVHVFDDSGNKCYVAKGANASGISCVRMSE